MFRTACAYRSGFGGPSRRGWRSPPRTENSLARRSGSLASSSPNDWLASQEAERKRLFARALGQGDASLTLLPSLLERAETAGGRSIVVAYFAGLREVLPGVRFRAALDALRETPGAFSVFAAVASGNGFQTQDAPSSPPPSAMAG